MQSTPSRSAARQTAKVQVDVQDLKFYLRRHQALKDITSRSTTTAGDRLHRPVRLRQIDAAARFQPHVRALSQASAPKAR